MTIDHPAPFDLDTPPPVEEFAHAVRFGFGRAILWLQRHDPAPYRDLILEAALIDYRYDSSEFVRSEYTSRLIELSAVGPDVSVALSDAVKIARDDMEGDHVVDLTAHLARGGDQHLRRALYAVLRSDPWRDRVYNAVIEADGITGLLHVADLMGGRDSPTDAYPGEDQHSAFHRAESSHGAEAAWAALDCASRSRRRIAAFCRCVRRYDREMAAKRGRQEQPLSDADVEHLLGLPRRRRRGARRGRFHPALHRWARTAPDESLIRVAQALVELPDDDCRLRDYLRVFHVRQFPLEPDRLIELVRLADVRIPIGDQYENRRARIGFDALRALWKVRHPAVRALAFELIADSQWQAGAYDLLIENFEPDDLPMLLQRFRQEPDEEHRHHLADTIGDLCERYHPTDEVEILLMLYENTRCTVHRGSWVRYLKEQDRLPSWLDRDCELDAENLEWQAGSSASDANT